MDPRESRFRLRFESGPCQGEELPLPEGVAALGRRPENPIVVSDPSVSGRHAEIHVSGDRLRLVDLGSTNGTKIDGDRVDEHPLAHGDAFALGNVQLRILDGSLDPGTPQVSAAAPGPASDELSRVSAESLAASGKRSWLGGILVLAALGAGAAAFWWFGIRGGENAIQAQVVDVPGNLLPDGSFESEEGEAWSSADAAPGLFDRDAGYARSGGLGLGALLADGEWAFSSSPSFECNERRGLEARAWLWAEDGALARVGVELSSTRDAGPDFIAWAPARAKTDGFEEVVLRFAGLPGYDRGRLVVAARGNGDGALSLDDASVVLTKEIPASGASFLEFEARPLGGQASTAALVRGGRLLFGGITLGSWHAAGLVGEGRGTWRAEASESGFVYHLEGKPGASDLRLLVNAAVAEGGTESDQETGWVASIGPEGYRSHAYEFEIESATSLLLGRGIDLVRLGFENPVSIRGEIVAGALALRIGRAEQEHFEVQLSFREERTQANRLREEAQAAERKGDRATALEAWSSLLDNYPFEGSLVAEAEEARGRLVQAGLEEVEEIRREVERAQFFELADLFEDCRARASDVAESYRSTQVEAEAQGVLEVIRAELERLGLDGESRDASRLEAVRAALGESAPELSQHISRALENLRSSEQED